LRLNNKSQAALQSMSDAAIG